MSFGKEILADHLANEQADFIRYENCLNNKEWITSNNRVLSIKDMSDSHISNVISYLERAEDDFLGFKHSLISMFKEEQEIRKDPSYLLDGTITIEKNGVSHNISVIKLIEIIKTKERSCINRR